MPWALPPIHPLSTPLVRRRQVRQQRWLIPPLAAELSGTLGREPPVLPPPWDQPLAVRQSGLVGLDPPHVLHYIMSVRQAPKKLRNDNKVTPRKVYSWFGLPEQFLKPVTPTRAPRRGRGVDFCALGWRCRLLHRRPLFYPSLWGFLHMLLGDLHRLLRRDSPRPLLRDFFASLRLFFCASVAWRCFSARWSSHRNFIIIRPLKHRSPSCSSGLVTTKRDAT